MAIYHPPKMITNNAAPILSSDLAYEAHGKCGLTRVLSADLDNGNNIFNAANEQTRNAWKVVFLQTTTVLTFKANNMSNGTPVFVINDCAKLQGITYSAGTEIMADITQLVLEVADSRPSGLCILYIDCDQS